MKSAVERRIRRKLRIRKKVFGTPERPRVCVSKSLKHLYVQAVDDLAGRPLFGLSTIKLVKMNPEKKLTKTQLGYDLGKMFGRLMLEKGFTQGVFDRSGFKYHGRVKAVCEGLREAGVKI